MSYPSSQHKSLYVKTFIGLVLAQLVLSEGFFFLFQLSEQVLAAQSRSLGDIRVSGETAEQTDAPVDKTVKDLWEVIR